MSLATDRYDYMRSAGAAFTPNDTVLLEQLGQPQLPTLTNGVPAPEAGLARPVPPAPVSTRAPGAAEPVPGEKPKQ